MSKPITSLKIILVGASSAGKSSCLHRFIDEVFNEEQTQTIGVEFGAKVVSLNGQKVKLQIWDTAGQERYRSVSRAYYRGSLAAVIVYDITNRDTFNEVPQWLADVRQLCGEDTTIMLIGNKTDLVVGNSERRQVPHTEASVFAQENGLMHMETSAQSGEFVPEAFLRVAKTTLQRLQQQQQQEKAQSAAGKKNGNNRLLVGGGGSSSDQQNGGEEGTVNSPVRLNDGSGNRNENSGDNNDDQDGSGNSVSACAKC